MESASRYGNVARWHGDSDGGHVQAVLDGAPTDLWDEDGNDLVCTVGFCMEHGPAAQRFQGDLPTIEGVAWTSSWPPGTGDDDLDTRRA